MSDKLEAEKRKAAEAEANCEAFRMMLEDSRIAYAHLYRACESVLEEQAIMRQTQSPGWLNRLCAVVLEEMATAELKSPFEAGGGQGIAPTEAGDCRSCGGATEANSHYCPMCSASLNVGLVDDGDK